MSLPAKLLGGKKKLYEKLAKTVYQTLVGEILFYQKLSGQLYEWGYEQNPYDPCTFNKTINGQKWQYNSM